MNTLVRIVVSIILSILMLSCNFSFGPSVDGNRNVVIQDRSISDDFESVKVSQGLDLYITQGNNVALSVEADENLHDIIMTDVENGTLRIYVTENIRSAASRRINLNVTNISAIKATSGSDVYSTNTITANEAKPTTFFSLISLLSLKMSENFDISLLNLFIIVTFIYVYTYA